MKKTLTIFDTRPQFIKASVTSKAILENVKLSELTMFTIRIFVATLFEKLCTPKPNYQLSLSGVVQKESFIMNKACVTMRGQTEWVELIEAGVNELVGAGPNKIKDAIARNLGRTVQDEQQLYGGGVAAKRIAEILGVAL